MVNTKQSKSQYESTPLPVDHRLLLTTAAAYYWAVVESVYEPITGGVHVHKVRLERVSKEQK